MFTPVIITIVDIINVVVISVIVFSIITMHSDIAHIIVFSSFYVAKARSIVHGVVFAPDDSVGDEAGWTDAAPVGRVVARSCWGRR